MNELTKSEIKMAVAIIVAGMLFIWGGRSLTAIDMTILVILGVSLGIYMSHLMQQSHRDHLREYTNELSAFIGSIGIAGFIGNWLYTNLYPESSIPIYVCVIMGAILFWVGWKMYKGWQGWK